MFSEQDVDRELKAALSVSPSPDFATRVLQRVEADRPSRRTAHYGWLAAAASLVIAAGGFYALNRTPAVVAGPTAPQVVERPAPQTTIPLPEAPAHRNTSESPRAETVRAARSALRTAEPEVLVPLNQMEGVRRLVREVNAGRLVETPAEPGPAPAGLPAALDVAPVAVTPLVVESIPPSPPGSGTETATPPNRGPK